MSREDETSQPQSGGLREKLPAALQSALGRWETGWAHLTRKRRAHQEAQRRERLRRGAEKLRKKYGTESVAAIENALPDEPAPPPPPPAAKPVKAVVKPVKAAPAEKTKRVEAKPPPVPAKAKSHLKSTAEKEPEKPPRKAPKAPPATLSARKQKKPKRRVSRPALAAADFAAARAVTILVLQSLLVALIAFLATFGAIQAIDQYILKPTAAPTEEQSSVAQTPITAAMPAVVAPSASGTVATADPPSVPSQTEIAEPLTRSADLPPTLHPIWERARAGEAEAQHDLGQAYALGRGVLRDYQSAQAWYVLAAAQNLADAQYNLAVLYERGLGVEKNIETALHWYEQAAAQQHKEALHNLGVLYFNGQDVPQNRSKAADYLRRAVDQGHIRATYHLGLMHRDKLIPQADVELGLILLQRAAAAGDSAAIQALRERENAPAAEDSGDASRYIFPTPPATQSAVRSMEKEAETTPPLSAPEKPRTTASLPPGYTSETIQARARDYTRPHLELGGRKTAETEETEPDSGQSSPITTDLIRQSRFYRTQETAAP